MSLNVEQLVGFVRREQETAAVNQQFSNLLTDEALVDRGEAVTGLSITQRSGKLITARCDNNESRLRPGTKVELRTLHSRAFGVISDVQDQGRTLEIRLDRDTAGLPDGTWTAREAAIDLSYLVIQCLWKLQPGAPGWGVFKVLAGVAPLVTAELSAVECDHRQQVLDQICVDCAMPLDASQRSAAMKCLQLPSLAGVQGPPGTGKTQTLAVVAEALARLGNRILLVAPTHQAVNNCLSTIHRMVPGRRVVKVGDELHRESLHDDVECRILKDVAKGLPAKMGSEVIAGMTFVSAMHHLALRSSGLVPNVVLIDEAAQLPLAQGACAGLFGAGSILLFGDDAQMPPVFASDVQDDECAISLFARLRQIAPKAIQVLETTYRLNDELCAAIRANFYPSGISLESSPEAAPRRLRLNLDDDPCTSPIQQALGGVDSIVWVKVPGGHSRQSNMREGQFVAELVATSIRNGLRPPDVAVVTPFRRQAAIIRAHLQSLLPDKLQMPIVDTVERVQGLTVELIVLSLCASDPEYIAGISPFLFSPNRLNVAISRARHKAIVAASPDMFTAVPVLFEGLQGQQLLRHFLNDAPLHVNL